MVQDGMVLVKECHDSEKSLRDIASEGKLTWING